jgi:lantibiotic transport system ATP-binding protein
MSTAAIETRDLSWSFEPKKPVLDSLSLEVPQQSIYGFLGPNGAGKTTTIKLLAGMLLSEKDCIFINGRSLKKNIPSIFQKVGFLIETPSLYLHLSGKENLSIITTLRSIPEKNIDHVLKIVGLGHAGHKKAGAYSLGMKQRLGIAMALLPEPDLLLLDEPVNGLDPNGMVEIREMLIRLNKEEGKTIFLSSHLLSEMEKTCSHIGIINNGKLLYQGTLEDMKESASASGIAEFTVPGAPIHLPLIQVNYPHAEMNAHDRILIPFTNSSEVSQINRFIASKDIPVLGLKISGGLEDWFMKIIDPAKTTIQ